MLWHTQLLGVQLAFQKEKDKKKDYHTLLLLRHLYTLPTYYSKDSNDWHYCRESEGCENFQQIGETSRMHENCNERTFIQGGIY